jgi:chromosome partitioning protein
VTGKHVLAVANQMGGVAKTTTVASLGAAMVEQGKKVLLVDLDPQGCLTFSLGQDPDKLPVSVHEVLLGDVEPNAAVVETSEGMSLLPANIDLAGAEAMLLMRAGREYALKRALAKLDGFDVVIIDCPPSLGVLTLNGLTAADDVIVPLQCETLAHRGVGQFLRTVTDVQQITNSNLKLLGALPTLYDSRTTHSRDVLLDVADRYDLPVLSPPIPRTVRFAEASASGASVIAGQGRGCVPGVRGRAAQALEVGQGAGHLHPGRLSRISPVPPLCGRAAPAQSGRTPTARSRYRPAGAAPG